MEMVDHSSELNDCGRTMTDRFAGGGLRFSEVLGLSPSPRDIHILAIFKVMMGSIS